MKNFIFGFCLLLSGCTGYQYVASPHYVPANTEKGEFTGNVSFNYYQLGYAFSDKFSVYTTGYYRNNDGGIFKATVFSKENGGVYIQTDEQMEFDIGLTFYKTLSNFFSYQIVSGMGYGSVKYSNTQDLLPDYIFSFDAKKLCLYIQPDFSIRINKYLDFSVFGRVNHARYYDINKSLTLGAKSEPEEYDQYFNSREIATLYFIEPGFQFRAGSENIKFQFMYSKIFDLNNTGIQYRSENLYLGLSVKVNLKSLH